LGRQSDSEQKRRHVPVLRVDDRAAPQGTLTEHGVTLAFGDGVAAFECGSDERIIVRTGKGATYEADLVILAIGVRPETGLAKNAPAVWVAWGNSRGPSNADVRSQNLGCRRCRGVQGTAICSVFGLAAAVTGASEKSLKRAGINDYEVIYLHPGQHAAYFPGASPIHLKLLFRRSDGRLLGAQACGEQGVDKRIDVIATVIQKEGTVFDLEEAELCYAPQFGAAKDPINVAGMIGANILHGDVQNAAWSTLCSNGALLLDVREPDEFESGHIPGARNIPLPELRGRLNELPTSHEIRLYGGVGHRAYYASRLLKQRGFRVLNLSGGYKTYVSCRNAGMFKS
jgi:rhodanese-related sulfurtransferase